MSHLYALDAPRQGRMGVWQRLFWHHLRESPSAPRTPGPNARKQSLAGIHKMRNPKRIFASNLFLIAGLSPALLGAAEVNIIITDQVFDPAQIVLQAGDTVTFDGSQRAGGTHTLVIVREADESERTHSFVDGSGNVLFEEPGNYRLFIREFPSIGGSAVVFPRAGATADLRQEMVSYSIGYDLGQNVVKKLENLDLALFNAGIEHAYRGQEPKLGWAEMDFIVKEYSREVARRARDEREQIAARNLEESQNFLARNARQPDVVVLPSGLQYKVLKRGTGPRPITGTKVRVRHRATFPDGTEFDNTLESQPAEFLLTDGVLPGYSEGLKLMSTGARWKLFVPPPLAYGVRGQTAPPPGAPMIEPNTTLIFEIELLGVGG